MVEKMIRTKTGLLAAPAAVYFRFAGDAYLLQLFTELLMPG